MARRAPHHGRRAAARRRVRRAAATQTGSDLASTGSSGRSAEEDCAGQNWTGRTASLVLPQPRRDGGFQDEEAGRVRILQLHQRCVVEGSVGIEQLRRCRKIPHSIAN